MKRLYCAVDGAPLKIPTLFAYVAYSMTDGLALQHPTIRGGHVAS